MGCASVATQPTQTNKTRFERERRKPALITIVHERDELKRLFTNVNNKQQYKLNGAFTNVHICIQRRSDVHMAQSIRTTTIVKAIKDALAYAINRKDAEPDQALGGIGALMQVSIALGVDLTELRDAYIEVHELIDKEPKPIKSMLQPAMKDQRKERPQYRTVDENSAIPDGEWGEEFTQPTFQSDPPTNHINPLGKLLLEQKAKQRLFSNQ